ncbi:hypothetical protein [Dendronalium sp. ChiSLP03b]|uniref:hypothetical protein n=1 Tax=Dendronalium sp. ChiSLP03b TaxID=3075381 RepID=UPI002ADBD6FE|nr:hypothetical protein [Dendronalium sp. ChiSLP03b]
MKQSQSWMPLALLGKPLRPDCRRSMTRYRFANTTRLARQRTASSFLYFLH